MIAFFCAVVIGQATAPGYGIGDNGVGPYIVGKPIPKAALVGAQYYTSFYADAQPLEGFTLKDFGLIVLVEGGPFSKWGMDHPGEPVPKRIEKAALKQAPKLKIQMIVVTDPALNADGNVHVGSTFAELRAAWTDAKLTMLPGMWEEPSCVVLKGKVSAFFAKCEGGKVADDAKVIRIVVR